MRHAASSLLSRAGSGLSAAAATRNDRWRGLRTGLAVALGCWFLVVPASGAEQTQPEPASAADPPAHPPIPTLDLGVVDVKNVEPTRNQTTKMSFNVHLALPQDTSPDTIATLEHLQHRLREQVIVAIRTAELGDFVDPELQRFRKRILYRINRLLKTVQVSDVLLANFTFSAG